MPCFQKLRKYNSYTVEKSVERQDTAGSQFLAYGNGFIKYSNDGAIYTDANDEVYCYIGGSKRLFLKRRYLGQGMLPNERNSFLSSCFCILRVPLPEER